MALELLVAEQFVYAKLFADPTLTAAVGGRIYIDDAPQGAAFPYVVMFPMSAADFRVVNTAAPLLWTNALFLVKAVGKTASYTSLSAIVQQIETLLHGAQGTATDGTIYAAVRESPFQMPETGPGGEQYRHAGAIYRILAKET